MLKLHFTVALHFAVMFKFRVALLAIHWDMTLGLIMSAYGFFAVKWFYMFPQ